MTTTMSTTPTFGERLRAMRTARGLTLAELANRAGMHLQGVANIESGRRPNPTWETVVALSKALGVSPDAFLTDDDRAKDDTPE